MAIIKRVCVFCGGSNDVDKRYLDLAYDFGKTLSEIKMDLIYGGGGSGLMGKVAAAAHEYGSDVLGIFPVFLEEYESLNREIGTTVFVNSMFQRKEELLGKADVFVILPGGFGTLDEFFEVLTLKVLSQLNKPIIILNYENYWDEVIAFCKKIIELKFSKIKIEDFVYIVNDISEAKDLLIKLNGVENA